MTTPRRYYTRIDETSNYANDIADELDAMFKSDCCDWDLVREAARVLRLCRVTTKPTAPRVLQSADEAPCGSLLKPKRGWATLRFPSGSGFELGPGSVRRGHDWAFHSLGGPVEVLAEGLTEAECRHLSGLSAAEAIAWCEARAAAQGAAK